MQSTHVGASFLATLFSEGLPIRNKFSALRAAPKAAKRMALRGICNAITMLEEQKAYGPTVAKVVHAHMCI